jgi:hypothetical protein
MKSIILLAGPVGASKTTVAQALVAATPGPIAYIEGDTFWSFIPKSAGTGRHRNFRTIMTAMVAAAVPYAVADHEVVLDFSIPPWFLPTARKVVQVRDVPLDYVVLRPSEAVCATRAAARKAGRISDHTSYLDLYADFDVADPYILQDDESAAPVIAARICDGLIAGRFRLE